MQLRRLFLVLPLIVFSSFSFAYEVAQKDNRLMLSATSCTEIKDLLRKMDGWNPHSLCHTVPLYDRREVCEADITSCVPKGVVENYGVTPKYPGPNCWNSTLVLKGILPFLRYTDITEIKLYLESPLCRPLKNAEARQAGDVGAIRIVAPNGQTVEYHSFIYISDKMAFSKDGVRKSAPYILEPLEQVYQSYNVAGQERCQQNEIDPDSGCVYATSYFRCQSMAEFLTGRPHLPPPLIGLWHAFSLFEYHLQEKVFRGTAIPEEIREAMLAAAKETVDYLEQYQKMKDDGAAGVADAEFMLKALQTRLDGIVQQLGSSGEEKLSSELSNFEDSLWQYTWQQPGDILPPPSEKTSKF